MLITAALLLLVLRMPLVCGLLLSIWIGVETFLYCKRFGRPGYLTFSVLAATFVLFLISQGYAYWSNLQLISAIEGRGASAAMSGNFLPGYVNYISLGPDVGDAELESILRLDGLDRLEFVVAKGSQFTDRGLLLLQSFKHLEHVYVDGANVSEDGIKRLELALPDCLIVYPADKE